MPHTFSCCHPKAERATSGRACAAGSDALPNAPHEACTGARRIVPEKTTPRRVCTRHGSAGLQARMRTALIKLCARKRSCLQDPRAGLKARGPVKGGLRGGWGARARSHNGPGARDAERRDRRTPAPREVFRWRALSRVPCGAPVSAARAGRAGAARQSRRPPTARTNTTRNASTSASVVNPRRLFYVCSHPASNILERFGGGGRGSETRRERGPSRGPRSGGRHPFARLANSNSCGSR